MDGFVYKNLDKTNGFKLFLSDFKKAQIIASRILLHNYVTHKINKDDIIRYKRGLL
jgi:hypothetical protein